MRHEIEMTGRPMTAALLLSLAATLSCNDGPIGPDEFVDATLILVLESNEADDGALLLEIDAPASPAVESANSGYRVFSRVRNDGTVGAAIVGDLVEGPILLLRFPSDVNARDVHVSILQVADRQNALRPDASAHAITVTAP